MGNKGSSKMWCKSVTSFAQSIVTCWSCFGLIGSTKPKIYQGRYSNPNYSRIAERESEKKEESTAQKSTRGSGMKNPDFLKVLDFDEEETASKKFLRLLMWDRCPI